MQCFFSLTTFPSWIPFPPSLFLSSLVHYPRQSAVPLLKLRAHWRPTMGNPCPKGKRNRRPRSPSSKRCHTTVKRTEQRQWLQPLYLSPHVLKFHHAKDKSCHGEACRGRCIGVERIVCDGRFFAFVQAISRSECLRGNLNSNGAVRAYDSYDIK